MLKSDSKKHSGDKPSVTYPSISLSGGRVIDFTTLPRIMGIINCTPDSFYPESRKQQTDIAVRQALVMEQDGADIIDIGGESSRPGSDSVPGEEEINRILPVIKGIREKSTIPISVDTRKSKVAEAALDNGADIINDISALRDDSKLSAVAAERAAPVILMHMQGNPKNMQKAPAYKEVIKEIYKALSKFKENAVRAGIDEHRIIIDPGIGFGKRVEDNLSIIKHISRFTALGPVLIGASRKSFIGSVLDRKVESRLPGTITVQTYAALGGAAVLRVHDVQAGADIRDMLQALYTAG